LWPCHFTIKKYLKAKEEEEEELWKLKYNFTMQKTYNPQKNPLKRKPKSFKIVLL
jgi:phosphatidate phosphatase PAH1